MMVTSSMQVSWNSKDFSEEPLIAEELVLLILWFWHQYSQYNLQKFKIWAPCTKEHAKEMEKEKEQKNTTTFTKNYGEVLTPKSNYLL